MMKRQDLKPLNISQADPEPTVDVRELLDAVQLAYRKHHLEDESIGWDELSDVLADALSNAMGPAAFVVWQEAQGGVMPATNGQWEDVRFCDLSIPQRRVLHRSLPVENVRLQRRINPRKGANDGNTQK